MHRLPALLAAFVALPVLLSGCTSASRGPAAPAVPAAPPAPLGGAAPRAQLLDPLLDPVGDQLITVPGESARIELYDPAVSYATGHGAQPLLMLHVDGRAFTPVAQAHRPAVNGLQVAQLSESVRSSVLAAVKDLAGSLAPASTTLPSLVISVDDGGTSLTKRVDAGQVAARLSALQQQLRVQSWASVSPTTVAVAVTAGAPSDRAAASLPNVPDGEQRPAPVRGPRAAGGPSSASWPLASLPGDGQCAVLSVEHSAQLLPAAASATQVSSWQFSAATYALGLRVLAPHESSCARPALVSLTL